MSWLIIRNKVTITKVAVSIRFLNAAFDFVNISPTMCGLYICIVRNVCQSAHLQFANKLKSESLAWHNWNSEYISILKRTFCKESKLAIINHIWTSTNGTNNFEPIVFWQLSKWTERDTEEVIIDEVVTEMKEQDTVRHSIYIIWAAFIALLLLFFIILQQLNSDWSRC